jgi:hypothetical protein
MSHSSILLREGTSGSLNTSGDSTGAPPSARRLSIYHAERGDANHRRGIRDAKGTDASRLTKHADSDKLCTFKGVEWIRTDLPTLRPAACAWQVGPPSSVGWVLVRWPRSVEQAERVRGVGSPGTQQSQSPTVFGLRARAHRGVEFGRMKAGEDDQGGSNYEGPVGHAGAAHLVGVIALRTCGAAPIEEFQRAFSMTYPTAYLDVKT